MLGIVCNRASLLSTSGSSPPRYCRRGLAAARGDVVVRSGPHGPRGQGTATARAAGPANASAQVLYPLLDGWKLLDGWMAVLGEEAAADHLGSLRHRSRRVGWLPLSLDSAWLSALAARTSVLQAGRPGRAWRSRRGQGQRWPGADQRADGSVAEAVGEVGADGGGDAGAQAPACQGWCGVAAAAGVEDEHAGKVVILISWPVMPASGGLAAGEGGSLLCSVVMGWLLCRPAPGASSGSHRVQAGSDCARRLQGIGAGRRLPVRRRQT
jgi:hypothetical protein